MRLNSIRARMTATFAASIAVVMMLVCGGIFWYTRRSAERAADATMRSAADKMERDLSLEGPQAGFEDEMHDLKVDNLAMLIVNRTGRVVRRSQDDVPTWPPRGDGWRIATKPVGAYTVVIATRWDKTAASLRNLATVLLTVSICVIVVSAVGAWLLVGRTLSPIGSLAQQAETASTESLHVRLSPPSPDAEVVGLVGTLNRLLRRLSDTAAARGRFYAAASHELRTPLQALSGHLDVALTKDRTKSEYQATVEEAYAQTRRLVDLVQDLLLLNQLDAVPAATASETIDVIDLCEQSLSHFRATIEERELRVQSDLPPSAEVYGPPTHLEMLVRNLFENAVKYTTPGGLVCIDVKQRPQGPRLEIFNESASLEPDVLAKLFEPFYRPDEARNSAAGGNGLGLAICKAIAVANGWEIATFPDPDGFRIAVDFIRRGPE